MKKQLRLFICFCLTASCSINPETTKKVHLHKGDTVKLNKSFVIPELYSHVIFQNGKIVNKKTLQRFKTSCIIDVIKLGPVLFQQGDFEVSKVSYNEEWYIEAAAIERYYTEIHLNAAEKNKSVILTCQILDEPMRHHSFPVTEIQQAMGNYIIFSSIDNKH